MRIPRQQQPLMPHHLTLQIETTLDFGLVLVWEVWLDISLVQGNILYSALCAMV